jgi:hypothetical protein
MVEAFMLLTLVFAMPGALASGLSQWERQALGTVETPDEKSADMKATKLFHIALALRHRILVRIETKREWSRTRLGRREPDGAKDQPR